MATFIKGDTIILSIYDGSAYRPVACLTSNSLAETRNVIESQTKCDPGQIIKQAGTYTAEISLEGQIIDTTSAGGDTAKASHDYLHGIIVAGTDITWKMGSGSTDNDSYYGSGVLSALSLDAAAGDENATFSGTISVSGLVTTSDPNA